MHSQHFFHLFARRIEGLSACIGVLIDHGDLVAAQLAQLFATFAHQFLPHKLDAAALDIAIIAQKIDNRPGHCAFATARLTYNAQRFATRDLEGDILHSFNFAAAHFIGDGKVLNLQHW